MIGFQEINSTIPDRPAIVTVDPDQGNEGVTPPFVKNCTLRTKLRGELVLIRLSQDRRWRSPRFDSRLPWRAALETLRHYVISGSRLTVQFFTYGGVTPRRGQ